MCKAPCYIEATEQETKHPPLPLPPRRCDPTRVTVRQFRSPQEFAEEVGFWTEDFPVPTAVVPLREALERGSSRWIGAFRAADGVSGLCGVSVLFSVCAWGLETTLAGVDPPPERALSSYSSRRSPPPPTNSKRVGASASCVDVSRRANPAHGWLGFFSHRQHLHPPHHDFVRHNHDRPSLALTVPILPSRSHSQVMEALAESRDMHLEEGDSINPQKVRWNHPRAASYQYHIVAQERTM